MALQVTANVRGGLSISNAYVRVQDISLSKSRMSFGLEVFKDSTEAGKIIPVPLLCPDLDRESCAYDLASTDNPFKQAYTYLKTLSKFTGASDV